jgi:hypothetical protein
MDDLIIIEGPPKSAHLLMFSFYPLATHGLNQINCGNCGRIVTSFWTGDPLQNNFENFLDEITSHIDQHHRAAEEN